MYQDISSLSSLTYLFIYIEKHVPYTAEYVRRQDRTGVTLNNSKYEYGEAIHFRIGR